MKPVPPVTTMFMACLLSRGVDSSAPCFLRPASLADQGDRSLPMEGPICLSGRRRAESRRTLIGRRNWTRKLCCGHLVSSQHHLDRLLLLGLAFETSCTAKAGPMGLQRESAAPASRRRNVGGRAMPRPAANRSNYAFPVRTLGIPIWRMLVILRVIPILHPFSSITRHILHSVG